MLAQYQDYLTLRESHLAAEFLGLQVANQMFESMHFLPKSYLGILLVPLRHQVYLNQFLIIDRSQKIRTRFGLNALGYLKTLAALDNRHFFVNRSK